MSVAIGTDIEVFDPQVMKMLEESESGVLPIRVGTSRSYPAYEELKGCAETAIGDRMQ